MNEPQNHYAKPQKKKKSQLQQTTCYSYTYMECRQIYRWKAEQ